MNIEGYIIVRVDSAAKCLSILSDCAPIFGSCTSFVLGTRRNIHMVMERIESTKDYTITVIRWKFLMYRGSSFCDSLQTLLVFSSINAIKLHQFK